MSIKRFIDNSVWLLLDKIVRIAGGLLIGIWVARYLGPRQYGILNYALAYTALFALFVKLGMDQIVVREITRNPATAGSWIGTAFYIKFFGAILAICLILLSCVYIKTDGLTRTVIFLVSISFLFQSLEVVGFFYQAKVLSKYVVWARSPAFFISSGIKIYLILNHYSVEHFAAIVILESALTGGMLIFFYRRSTVRSQRWHFDLQVAARLLRDTWPLALSVFLISVYTKIDQVMIGSMLNNTQVGIYSVAVRLSDAWLFIPGIFVSTLMPYFVELRERNRELYNDRLKQLYSVMFWMGSLVGFATILWGKQIIGLLYGNAYHGAYAALVFNIWNGIFISQAVARGIWLITENLQRYRLYNNLFAVTLNVTGNVILIPKFGIAGAAGTTLLTQGLGTWIFPFLWRPLRASNCDLIFSANPACLFGAIKTLCTAGERK